LRVNWPCCPILNIAILDVTGKGREDRIAHCNKVFIIPCGDNLFCCGSSTAGILLRQVVILTVKVSGRATHQGKEKKVKLSTVAGRWVPGGRGSLVWSGQKKMAHAA